MSKFFSVLDDTVTVTEQSWYKNIVQPIINGINIALIPIIIIVASLGMIYAIYLGIQLARAESSDAREEAKKKMIYFIVAFVITIVLLILLKVLASNANSIYDLVNNFGKNKA